MMSSSVNLSKVLEMITDSESVIIKKNKCFYIETYYNIIHKARNENRKKGQEIYYELHHILPDFLFLDRKRKGPRGILDGNCEFDNNYVLLTFREHIISHMLLMSIFRGTRFFYSASSAINIMCTSSKNNHIRNGSYYTSKIIEKYRLQSKENISFSVRGTIPAKILSTNKPIGRVLLTHPNIISGEWVHHSKGILFSKERKQKLNDRNGNKNSNYKDEETIYPKLVYHIREYSDEILYGNMIIIRRFLTSYNATQEKRNKVSTLWIRNHYGTMENFVNKLSSDSGINFKYQTYFRGYKNGKN